MATEPEDLTSQIDGIKSLFTTTFHRRLTKSTIFHNGDEVGNYTEPNDKQLQLGFVPAPGDRLHVVYETDETVDGRVRGFPDDPLGLPVAPFPDPLEERLQSIEAVNDQQDVDIAALQAGGTAKEQHIDSFVVATNGQTAFPALSFSPVDVNDVKVTAQGVDMDNGIDFTVVGTTFTWTGAISLEAGWRLNISYFYIP